MSGFQYSGVTQSMKFTAKAGTYFWSNGTAWGTCRINGKSAELTVLKGSVALKNFTIDGVGSKKLKDAQIGENQSLKLEVM